MYQLFQPMCGVRARVSPTDDPERARRGAEAVGRREGDDVRAGGCEAAGDLSGRRIEA